MIRLDGVAKSYRPGAGVVVSALKGVSLEIAAGEFVTIMGPSGSGKSTLLNVIGCLDTPDSGRYRLLEHEVERLPDERLAQLRGRHIGFVFQSFNLIPRIDALRNVELPLVYRRVPPTKRRQLALDMLASVGLADRAHHSPMQLSGGQQQRVAIARALVTNPDLLIADEPTGSLDTAVSCEIMGLLRELHAAGKTIVMVTHEEEIARYAWRVVRLRDGVIERDERV